MYQGTMGRLDMLDHSECWQVRNFASLLAEALSVTEIDRAAHYPISVEDNGHAPYLALGA
jgi:hypothetical protein